MLGDLYFFENQYAEAVDAYSHVQDKELQKEVPTQSAAFPRRRRYPEVITETAKELHEAGGSALSHHLLAESLWRQGMQTKDEAKKLQILEEKAKEEYTSLSNSTFKELSFSRLPTSIAS